MTIFLRISLGLFLLTLLSCTQFVARSVSKESKPCQSLCEKRFDKCNQNCRNNCQQCVAYAKQKASENYLYYQHEQYLKGGVIARDLQSYRDPLQCRKITCSCPADFELCMQSCGGIIQKRLQAAPVCQ